MTFDEAIDLAIKQANGKIKPKGFTPIPIQKYINPKHVDWDSVKVIDDKDMENG